MTGYRFIPVPVEAKTAERFSLRVPVVLREDLAAFLDKLFSKADEWCPKLDPVPLIVRGFFRAQKNYEGQTGEAPPSYVPFPFSVVLTVEESDGTTVAQLLLSSFLELNKETKQFELRISPRPNGSANNWKLHNI